jgi:hypothetical protein
MKDARFRFGVGVSVVWLGVMAYVAFRTPEIASAMKPNEWGDFFAGFFAPLAFLWLVLGYLQQGEELRLSSKALQLQADELRNSVEQQRELVDVTRQQVQHEKQLATVARKQRLESLKPKFFFSPGGASFSGDRSEHVFMLSNGGGTVYNVLAKIAFGDADDRMLWNIPAFFPETSHPTTFAYEGPVDFPKRINITYTDADGNVGAAAFVVEQDDPRVRSSSLKITQTG